MSVAVQREIPRFDPSLQYSYRLNAKQALRKESSGNVGNEKKVTEGSPL
jgi:hypothetical protein